MRAPSLSLLRCFGRSRRTQLERQAAEWKRQKAEEAAHRVYEERRQAAEAEQAERACLAAEQAERERQAAVERDAERDAQARKLAEESAFREAALEAERARPEYQERLAVQQAERDRVDLIDMIAMWNDAKGSRSARNSHARRYAAGLGLTSPAHVGRDRTLTHLGAVLTYAELALGIEPADADTAETMPEIRQDLIDHRRTISSATLVLAGPELRAADGSQHDFEKALSLRQRYCGYPDIITLPSPRSDIKKAWREQLLAAS